MSDKKLNRLIKILKKMDSAVLAYSGGVDSTLLLKAIQLSGIKAIAATACSQTMPKHDLLFAKKFAKQTGIEHIVIKTDELKNKDFTKNPHDRCFHCKEELFKKLIKTAQELRYNYILDGSSLDDLNDWRPGRKAALKHNVRSPLIEAKFTKKDIRSLSQKLGLPFWDRPASPCLASRIPYGRQITTKNLKQISASEDFIRSLGFREFRSRHYGNSAKIELNENEFKKINNPKTRQAIVKKLKSLGYKSICLDLEPFKSGRMNELIIR